MIVVRTHGGLGNQLFQIGQAMMRQAEAGGMIVRFHSDRYKVRREASPAFSEFDKPVAGLLRLASAARIPKLILRSGIARCQSVRFAGTEFLDGYFQFAEDWEGFSTAALDRLYTDFRNRFAVCGKATRAVLVHLRLGDFFACESEERAHATDRLTSCPEGACIVTNRDDLVVKFAHLLPAGAEHVPSADWSAERLLSFMAGFADIRSNDSTLGFWAALLGGGEITLSDPRLKALWRAMRR